MARRSAAAAGTGERRFYKIGDAARLVGVKPHVLRYWESEVPELRPLKTRGAHRMYGAEHLALARRIRALVQDQGFTVQGARRRLREEAGGDGAPAAGPPGPGDEALRLRRDLLALRAELEAVLDGLDDAARDARKTVRVEAVRPVPVAVPSGRRSSR